MDDEGGDVNTTSMTDNFYKTLHYLKTKGSVHQYFWLATRGAEMAREVGNFHVSELLLRSMTAHC